jgi:hypothetical protein
MTTTTTTDAAAEADGAAIHEDTIENTKAPETANRSLTFLSMMYRCP